MIMVAFNAIFAILCFYCFIWMLNVNRPGSALLNLFACLVNIAAVVLHFYYQPLDEKHTASFIDKSPNQIQISKSYS